MVLVDFNVIFPILSTILAFTEGQIFQVGRRVCPQRRIRYEIVPMKQTYTRPFYISNCRINSTCDSTKMIYKTAVRTVFYKRVIHNTVKRCCPGWQMENPRDRGCMAPICENSCENGGTCIGPNVCSCTKQYMGSQCNIDIDECKVGNHDCQQLCSNTIGGYTCTCYDGFRLMNKTHCEFCPLCLPAMEQMMNKVNDLQQRITFVEKEKEEMMGNFSVLENHYHEAMVKVDELREATVRTMYITQPTTTTTTTKKSTTNVPDDSPYSFDRLASLSEQISMLEERLAGCNCWDGNRRSRRRHFP